jgi:hypothetical protein
VLRTLAATLAVTEGEKRKDSLQNDEERSRDRERDQKNVIDVGAVKLREFGHPPAALSKQP